ELGKVARGQLVATEALAQSGEPERTYVLHDETRTLLRPDLVVASLTAPRQILSGRAFTVEARVAEQNGDVGATAALTLTTGTTVLGTVEVDVAAGGSVSKTFGVTLSSPGTFRLDATISGAAPAETDATNNFQQ